MNKLIEKLQELADKANDNFYETVSTCYETESSYYDGASDAYENAADEVEKYTNEVVERLEALSAEHPYKVVGQPDTYIQYNEGWQDCLDRVMQIMKGGGVDESC